MKCQILNSGKKSENVSSAEIDPESGKLCAKSIENRIKHAKCCI